MSDKRLIERMRTDLFYVDQYRGRASALDNLGALLRCEYPGTVSEVVVQPEADRWWRRFKTPSPHRPDAPEQIVLTDDERREFRDWCEERAAKLRKQADDLEMSVAQGASDER